ncbi:MAG: hypothetical protein EBV83_05460, partial [Verrucomicrobia bacterium]|nr:hypothetical protein [Verrucomicrobiota bacterium]
MFMSQAKVHPTAIVDKGAKIGSGCEIGPGAIVESEVELGRRVGVAEVAGGMMDTPAKVEELMGPELRK